MESGHTKPVEISTATIEVVEFRLGGDRYAVETRHVTEVQPLKELTSVPCTPAFVVGIVNVRGRIVAVLDLKRFLDLPTQGSTDLHYVILVRVNDVEVGLLADVISGVRSVTPDAITVLNLEGMLADPRLIVNEEV